MWHTSEGDRILAGHERRLFLEGLGSLMSYLNDDDEWMIGVPVFDRLSLPEKFAIMESVANALLHEEVATPELTAVSEGTVGAIYAQLISLVSLEIETGRGDDELRQQIRAAAMEAGDDLADFHPEADSDEAEELGESEQWHELVDMLSERILWDDDWMREVVGPDDPPDQANAIREFAGILPDYYTAVPPDPNPAQLKQIRETLAKYVWE